MKKLHELLKKPLLKGDVGIEIECEGERLFPHHSVLWKTEADNSLRGQYPEESCEWVLNEPVPKEDVRLALKELFDVQAANKAKFKFSFRTSVHIHINVGHLTRDQVMAMAYAYYLIEDLMLEYCAEHRRSNRFCLSIGQAEGAIPYIKRMISTEEWLFAKSNPQNAIRYSSLNLEALFKYGSLEFRALEGNADIDRIDTWVKAIVNLRTFIEKIDDIRDVHDVFLFEGPKGLIERALGNVANFFKTKGYTNSISHAFSTTIELPFSYIERKEQVKPVEVKEKPIELVLRDMAVEELREVAVPMWQRAAAEPIRPELMNARAIAAIIEGNNHINIEEAEL